MRFKKTISILTVTLVAFILVMTFYGDIVKSPDNVLFAKSGDGLKSTYCSIYHLKYDSLYNYTSAMNYPFGESVYYTDGQPFIVNALIILKKLNVDFSINLIAILNIWLLFSIVLGVVFLYLLLRKLELPFWYSLMVSCIIIFLSPQINRMGGHYTLGYLYFIPLFFLLLHRYWEKPDYKASIYIGLLTFYALGTHAYYFAFYGFVIFFAFLVWWKSDPKKYRLFKTLTPHFIIQLILPFVLFDLIMGSEPDDRTAYPWGFFHTRATLESVFLPIGKPYGTFLNFIHTKWEGVAYVGLVSTIATIVLLVLFFQRLIKNSNSPKWQVFNSNNFLKAILLSSVLALLFSFAFPFQLSLQWLVNYLGPLRQFRAIGRFSWLFYYTINILAFYLLWQLTKKHKTRIVMVLLGAALLLGMYDAWLNVRNAGNWLNNKNQILADIDNESYENEWVNQIKRDEFQTIMPLPYFHVGSETFWISGSDESDKNAFFCSMKTGIPLNSVMLGRTSISQTMQNLSLYYEPLKPFKVLDKYSTKDILLMVQKGESLTKNESRFLNYASYITQNSSFELYRLPVDSVKKMQEDYVQQIRNEVANRLSNQAVGADTNNLSSRFGPPWLKSENNLKTYLARRKNCILDTVLSRSDTSVYLSFWMSNIDKDLIPRTRIELVKYSALEKAERVFYLEAFRLVEYVDCSGWGLVEFNINTDFVGQRIQLNLLNELTTSESYQIDNLFIYSDCLVYADPKFIFYNNRFIVK